MQYIYSLVAKYVIGVNTPYWQICSTISYYNTWSFTNKRNQSVNITDIA